MQIKNTRNNYGLVAKILHWSLFILILLQYYFIVWAKFVLPEKSPLIGFYIGKLHKPFGMLTLVVAIVAIVWRLLNHHPEFPKQMPNWEIVAARLVHFLLYLSLIALPVSGIMMSVAANKAPNFFGLYQVPMFMETSETWSNFFFGVHAFFGILLIPLIALHILAALKHHFIYHDSVLKRMWLN